MYTSAQRTRALDVLPTLLFAATVLAVAALVVTTPVANAHRGRAQALLGHQNGTADKVTVRITGANDDGDRVTNGGVAGTGRFTASGAITDKGTCVAYRTVKGAFITLRFVTVGTKGTITFIVRIDTDVGTSRWTISSGTKAYKGLHGKGIERENIDYTVSTLTGTVAR